MKIITVLPHLLLVAATGYLGFAARGLLPPQVTSSSLQEIPPFELFYVPRSFSEVEQARAQLHALSSQFLYRQYLERLHLLQARRSRNEPEPPPGQRFPQSIQALEQSLEEFRGTGEELTLTHALLSLLRQEQLADRWLDAYLDMLYHHPTADLVGQEAKHALTLARSANREEELFEAFRHVSNIPFDFVAKRFVLLALGGGALAGVSPPSPSLP
ncbi:MAG: hypothetical protein HS113_03170 [Verrucomicrobiales bacterium]|nr:hypothetical protein [Verrucomicrobiales bacterium]